MERQIQPKKDISDALARRLPSYYRHVCIMEAEGITNITSSLLASRVGNTSAQVRQDFFTCGGVDSYNTETLKAWLRDIINIKTPHHMVVCGAGNLGRAIISFKEFNEDNFFIDAIFDSNLFLEGMKFGDIPISNAAMLPDYLRNNDIDIVVITAPATAAEGIMKIAEEAGVKGIWNFAPVDLRSTEGTEVQNVHLTDSLMTLSFRMNEKNFVRDEDIENA